MKSKQWRVDHPDMNDISIIIGFHFDGFITEVCVEYGAKKLPISSYDSFIKFDIDRPMVSKAEDFFKTTRNYHEIQNFIKNLSRYSMDIPILFNDFC